MIFITCTHHGDYLHEARTEVPDDMSTLEAWELVQGASPYTPGILWEPTDALYHCAANFIALRSGDTSRVYSPHPGWVSGYSWTWIIRPDLEV